MDEMTRNRRTIIKTVPVLKTTTNAIENDESHYRSGIRIYYYFICIGHTINMRRFDFVLIYLSLKRIQNPDKRRLH